MLCIGPDTTQAGPARAGVHSMSSLTTLCRQHVDRSCKHKSQLLSMLSCIALYRSRQDRPSKRKRHDAEPAESQMQPAQALPVAEPVVKLEPTEDVVSPSKRARKERSAAAAVKASNHQLLQHHGSLHALLGVICCCSSAIGSM